MTEAPSLLGRRPTPARRGGSMAAAAGREGPAGCGAGGRRDRLVAVLVAFDPGRNVGVAYVTPAGELVRTLVVSPEEAPTVQVPAGATVLVGDGTGSAALAAALRGAGHDPVLVPEEGTTLEARELYFRDHPPGLLMRLLPPGMRSPGRPLDDYAAYAIALRYLAAAGSVSPRRGA